LVSTVERRHSRAAIDKLTHEMAVLTRLKFAAKSEAFCAEQKSLLEGTIDENQEVAADVVRRLDLGAQPLGRAPVLPGRPRI